LTERPSIGSGHTFAPGARVLIRDAEWLIRRNDTNYSISPTDGTAQNIALGWEDVRDLKFGTITREVMDDTLPGRPRKKIITYEAPFDRCDREKDYAEVWGNLEKREKDQLSH
jgi:hypothetical protein